MAQYDGCGEGNGRCPSSPRRFAAQSVQCPQRQREHTQTECFGQCPPRNRIDVLHVGRINVNGRCDIPRRSPPIIAHKTIHPEARRQPTKHEDCFNGRCRIHTRQQLKRQAEIVSQRRIIVKNRIAVAMIKIGCPSRVKFAAANQKAQLRQPKNMQFGVRLLRQAGTADKWPHHQHANRQHDKIAGIDTPPKGLRTDA